MVKRKARSSSAGLWAKVCIATLALLLGLTIAPSFAAVHSASKTRGKKIPSRLIGWGTKTGTLLVGNKISDEAWPRHGAKVTFTYSWFANSKKISSLATLKLSSSWAGQKISEKITASLKNYESYSKTIGWGVLPHQHATVPIVTITNPTGTSPIATATVATSTTTVATIPTTTIPAQVAIPPVVSLPTATDLTDSSATVETMVSTQDLPTTVNLIFTDGGLVETLSENLVASTGEQAVSFDLTSLDPNSDYSYDLVASNSAGQSPEAGGTFSTLSAPFSPTPTIITSDLPALNQGQTYAQSLTATDCDECTWGLVSGILPPGLSLSAAGLITGTATTSGNWTFTVGALASDGNSASQILSINVLQVPTISTAELPSGTTAVAYSASLESDDCTDCSWSVSSGILPAGLSLSSSGIISGTPSSFGTSSFMVEALSQDGNDVTKSLSITISEVPSILTVALPNGTNGLSYSQNLSANYCSECSWSLASGNLPAGLSLSTGGTISGVPSGSGTSTFTVEATNAQNNSKTQPLSINILEVPVIQTKALPNATSNSTYSSTIEVSDCSSCSFSLVGGSLPKGLTLSPEGTVAGITTVAGTYSLTVEATAQDSESTSQVISLTVVPAIPVVTTTSLPSATQGVAYFTTLEASSGVSPYSWNLVAGSTLPSGLSLSSGGSISGTTEKTGVFSFDVSVSGADGGTVETDLSLTVASGASPVISTTELPYPQRSVAYSQKLNVVDGVGPFVWSVASGSLPTGLSLNSSTGVISGSANTLGNYSFTIGATDSNGNVAQQSYSVTVALSEDSGNWSGYAELASQAYSSINGTFSVPSVAPNQSDIDGLPPALSDWIGIDGYSNSDLIQAGVEMGTSGGYFLWTEILPAAETPCINGSGGEEYVSSGDIISVSISQVAEQSNQWQILLTDDSNPSIYCSVQETYSGPATSAEWITEAPTYAVTSNGTTTDKVAPTLDYTSPVGYSGLATANGSTTLMPTSLFGLQLDDSTTSSVTSTESLLSPLGFSTTYGSSVPSLSQDLSLTSNSLPAVSPGAAYSASVDPTGGDGIYDCATIPSPSSEVNPLFSGLSMASNGTISGTSNDSRLANSTTLSFSVVCYDGTGASVTKTVTLPSN